MNTTKTISVNLVTIKPVSLKGRVARIRENLTDPDPHPFRKNFTNPDPDPKRIRPLLKNCYEISQNPNIFNDRYCNSFKIALL